MKKCPNLVDQRVGQRIREARLAWPAMTPTLAAQFLNVSCEQLLAFEDGRERPSPAQLLLLADLLEVELSYFFRGFGDG